MKSACVGVLSIVELKNARWNIEIRWIMLIGEGIATVRPKPLRYLIGVPFALED